MGHLFVFGGSMVDNQKEIKVAESVLPNRKERRHIEKTGKSVGGAEVLQNHAII